MKTRTIMIRLLPLCLALGSVACDDAKPGDKKESTKGAAEGKAAADGKEAKDAKDEKVDAKADEGGDAEDEESGDPNAEESGDANAEESGDAHGEESGDAKADEGGDAKADDGGDEKADDGGKTPKGDDGGKKPPKEDGPKIDAKKIFLKKCKSCHGIKGDADTKLGRKHDIPDWTEKGWKTKWPLAKVKEIVTNGEEGTKMKAFKEKLSKDEIAAVAQYSRKLGK